MAKHTDKPVIENILHKLWKKDTGYEYIDIARIAYNRALQDVQKAIDSKQEEPTSKYLGEYINELSKQFPEVSFAKVCKIATRAAKWQKAQMMAKAINTKASLIMSVPSICISLPLGVNVGDKVKVIVIKED